MDNKDIKELIEQSISYLDLINKLTLAKQQIEIEFHQCLPNKKFNKYTTRSKKKWYKKHLHDRINCKIYRLYGLDFFGLIESIIDEVLPKAWDKSFDYYVDSVQLGESEYKPVPFDYSISGLKIVPFKYRGRVIHLPLSETEWAIIKYIEENEYEY